MWWWIPGVVLATVALIELFLAWALWSWKDSLDYYQHGIERDQRNCYVCITGASVTSFAGPMSFCATHRAHWTLIRDLEQKSVVDDEVMP